MTILPSVPSSIPPSLSPCVPSSIQFYTNTSLSPFHLSIYSSVYPSLYPLLCSLNTSVYFSLPHLYTPPLFTSPNPSCIFPTQRTFITTSFSPPLSTLSHSILPLSRLRNINSNIFCSGREGASGVVLQVRYRELDGSWQAQMCAVPGKVQVPSLLASHQKLRLYEDPEVQDSGITFKILFLEKDLPHFAVNL